MSVEGERGYAGDVSVSEAYDQLLKTADAALVDVRTEPEWQFVGAPDLTALAKAPIFLPWQVYPLMQTLPNFVEALTKELARRGIGRDAPLLFLCRSGVRSKSAAAAMTAAGWTQCYNIVDGFEGPADERRRRGGVAGWKAKGLPWSQS